jgi:hypothetical protein
VNPRNACHGTRDVARSARHTAAHRSAGSLPSYRRAVTVTTTETGVNADSVIERIVLGVPTTFQYSPILSLLVVSSLLL